MNQAPDDGMDVTLIRWMLSLTPEERLAVLQGFTDSVDELADGVAVALRPPPAADDDGSLSASGQGMTVPGSAASTDHSNLSMSAVES